MNKNRTKMVVVGFLVSLAVSSLLQAATVRIVDAYGVDTTYFTARAGELVFVGIDGDNDTDLDLCVGSQWGTTLGCSVSWSDSEEVVFVAPYTGTYYVSVENLGSVYNEYLIWVE